MPKLRYNGGEETCLRGCLGKGKAENMMKTVRVAAAVIRKEDEFYATQRGYGPWKDGWEFPGGKIEKGETPEQALRREIREELDTEISVGEKLAQVEYDYPEFHLSMACFACAVVAGGLTLKEHESARWLRWEDLDAVAWLPADREAVAQMKGRLCSPDRKETDPWPSSF